MKWDKEVTAEGARAADHQMQRFKPGHLTWEESIGYGGRYIATACMIGRSFYSVRICISFQGMLIDSSKTSRASLSYVTMKEMQY